MTDSGRSVEVPFVACLGLVLGIVAVVASSAVLGVAVWLATLIVMAPRLGLPGTRPRSDQTDAVALAVIAVFAALSYTDKARFHGDGRFVHHHEFVIYHLGSQYFDELGFDGLHLAAYRALAAQDAADEVPLVRNLRSYELEGARVTAARAVDVPTLFSPERWSAFQADVKAYRQHIPDDGWQFVLNDHGFNATPFWTMVGATLTSPFDVAGSLFTLAALDPLFILLATVLLWRTFGAITALLFAIFFLANSFATFGVNGGALLRQMWLCSLVTSVCAYASGRPRLAGIALAVSALDRVFPVFFCLVPLALWMRGRRAGNAPRDPGRFFAALAVTGLVLGTAATMHVGGLDVWVRFFANIAKHSDWYYFNQIALRNLFIVDPAAAAGFALETWDEAGWFAQKDAWSAHTRLSLTVVRGTLGALLALVVVTRPRPLVGLALTCFAPFVLLYPSDYYYTLLGLTLLSWRSAPRLVAAMIALQVVFRGLRAGLPSPLQLELVYWLVSVGLLTTLLACLARAIADLRGGTRRAALGIGGLGALALVVAVPLDLRGPAMAGGTVIDITRGDVRPDANVEVRSMSMAPHGNAWLRSEHILCTPRRRGATVTIGFRSALEGPHRVKVTFTTTPDSGIVQPRINDVTLPRVNLYAPRPGVISSVHDVTLRAGSNELQLSAAGRSPRSSGSYFAVDRIVVIPVEASPGDAPSLERAVTWLRTHPADVLFAGADRARIHDDVLAAVAAVDTTTPGATPPTLGPVPVALETALAGDIDPDRGADLLLSLRDEARKHVLAPTGLGRSRLRAPFTPVHRRWQALLLRGTAWAMATNDVAGIAELCLGAEATGAKGREVDRALGVLTRHQEPDGSFGPTTVTDPESRRRTVQHVVLALLARGRR